MELMCKVLLCGDGGVGKTSIRLRYIGLGFGSSYSMTIGSDMSIVNVKSTYKSNHYVIKLVIWDLAGQPRFSEVRKSYYHGANATLLVFDVSNPQSLINIVDWMNEIKTHNRLFPIPVILVGNKIDLRSKLPDKVYMTPKDGLRTAKFLSEIFFNGEWTIPYIEASALTGDKIDSAFQQISQLFLLKGFDSELNY